MLPVALGLAAFGCNAVAKRHLNLPTPTSSSSAARSELACTDPDAPISLPFVVAMPKIELHAHLSGSIRRRTLVAILKDKGEPIPKPFPRGFPLFTLIHEIVSTPTILARVTREVVADFANDNAGV
jgi:hypothetical protein